MFEQDYVMRLINEMVRAILKLIFHIDTESPTEEIVKDEKTKEIIHRLNTLVDQGKIDEAENELYDILSDHEQNSLEIALLFYSHLNEKDDAFLTENDFSRDEVKSGLKNVAQGYGLSSLAETFLS